MILPLQTSVTNGVKTGSGTEGLNRADGKEQFSGVLKTITSPEDKAVPRGQQSQEEVLESSEKVVALASVEVAVEDLVEEESSALGDDKNQRQNASSEEGLPQLAGKEFKRDVSEEERENSKEDPDMHEDNNTSSPSIAAAVAPSIYADQTAIKYKTGTFEGTVTLKTSAALEVKLPSEIGIAMDGMEDKSVKENLLAGVSSTQKLPIADLSREGRTAQINVEHSEGDFESLRVSEVLGANPMLMRKTERLSGIDDRSAASSKDLKLDSDIHDISTEDLVIKETSLHDEGKASTEGGDILNREDSGEPLEALDAEGNPMDLNTVPKPNNMITAGEVTSSEKTIRIMETGAIHQMYEAIADAHEVLKPNESKTLTLTLTPEELGSVHVELKADEVGNIRAVLSLEKPETLKLFQQDVEQLKTVLKEIGIEESNVNLQLLADNNREQRHQSEYVTWDEREALLARHSENKSAPVSEVPVYGSERKNSKHLDIRA